jgi:hypothetical protein
MLRASIHIQVGIAGHRQAPVEHKHGHRLPMLGAARWSSVERMKRFIIEREIPGASGFTEAELAEISRQSNNAMASLGVPYRWVNSYVTDDKIYCVHEADDEDVIREHARRSGFPANTVAAITGEIGPYIARLTTS